MSCILRTHIGSHVFSLLYVHGFPAHLFCLLLKGEIKWIKTCLMSAKETSWGSGKTGLYLCRENGLLPWWIWLPGKGCIYSTTQHLQVSWNMEAFPGLYWSRATCPKRPVPHGAVNHFLLPSRFPLLFQFGPDPTSIKTQWKASQSPSAVDAARR